MTIESRDITIRTSDGEMPAYIASPDAAKAPAIVMVSHVFGNDAGTREWVDRFAEHGFITVAPDIFWRTIPGPLHPEVPEERVQATERNQAFDRDAGKRDIASARDYVLALPQSNGKWAGAGYCFGGRYMLIAGAYLNPDAIVAFHPSKLGLELEAAAKITCPVSFHYGGADESVPMDLVASLNAALKNNPRAESYVYPGILHGFTAKSRPAYDKVAAETSFERALAVLDTLKR
jgi:carboxymethylenebutenolidase